MGPIFMSAFWVLLIAGGVLLVRYLVRQGRAEHRESALEVLKRRYARGEIEKDDFEAKRRDLT